MKLTISLGQMDVKLGDPMANWHTVQAMTAEAARRGSDLVVFPELWSTGYDLENAASYATLTDAGLFAQVAALAKTHQIAILGSCLSLLGEGRFGNTAVYFDANGRSLGEYSKLHLFRLMQEEQFLTAGEDSTLIETEWGKAGLTICYDLRFPELFRHYALAGAQLVFVPAEWPHPRLAHWRTLLRARAIENQMFVVACNRVGRSKDTDFFGHSCILDPWGEIVLELGEGEMLGTAVIDIAQVDAVRAKIPVFADRRPEVY
ncbi:carbon-nitrogen family hydrolase [Candidatus Leptofilum sp.]|uniref:carbon-nitrogen family hydrolase n=1 Tax=Candidatus Leptofilum sp. TaxID=3241576 RepID=UPI003B5C68A7